MLGVDLGAIVEKKEIGHDAFGGKVIAVDAFNTIYQFLSIIRQRDGTPLIDSKGNVTSHLSGLFYRNIKLMEKGVRLVYVFDGKPPSWKEGTIRGRSEIKEEAKRKWEEALREGRLDDARKHAQATSRATPEIIDESKELLSAMGIPCVQAVSEGEAEAAYLVMNGRADYAASQDYDALLFGAPRLIRNLTLSGKRRLPGRGRFADVHTELVVLDDELGRLGITREQLVWIALLSGTDFNEGVRGIGPKKGLKLVKECASLEEVHSKSGATEDLELWRNIAGFFINPDVSDAEIVFGDMEREKVIGILCDAHEFSKDRIGGAIDAYLKKGDAGKGQEKMSRWF